jgi:carbon-monoxide dehydrogenase medium subunit
VSDGSKSPGTLGEAVDLLASNPEALVIAGGQSLMPVLAFCVATPSLLVDLRRGRQYRRARAAAIPTRMSVQTHAS